ncbi:hypothetical protein N7495_007200 [Penicillium taxi]|uniref:uncharacterized protein n=1 Tax=Penicillium taxi TaxID=168475 RepID=UPI0025456B47|nr:uncharacterized protein N7495_007200 [Penicillium taxi]KAJ5895509.1 hypothetical protein N7495_007200 [Penicillium taxi]
MACVLQSKSGSGTVGKDLLPLISAVAYDFDFDFDHFKPLLKCAISDEGDDAIIRNQEGGDLVFDSSWTGWPENAKQEDLLSWFTVFSKKLAKFAAGKTSVPTRQQRTLAKLNDSIGGSKGKRRMDVGFVNDSEAGKESRYHRSQVLVPGELKSNPAADKASEAWLDLGRYAREVLSAQDTRRFILGFTICGSLMRVWTFDRLGVIASEQFDINRDGLRFAYIILGFLWINEEQLGFDPTIIIVNKERYIEVERESSTERIIIDEVMYRARCIAGRATTCWKAHLKGVVNRARYYWHGTVQINGTNDDVRNNVRGGLDVTKTANYRPERLMPTSSMTAGTPRQGRSISAASRKRPSSHIGAPLPPSKRFRSACPTEAGSSALPNRIHRRVILRDCGSPIYKASSRSALLTALEGCIEGHKSLHTAGFLHRDISINNLMINEDDKNPSWPSFLIDLDLSIKTQREVSSGAKGKIGTRAFMVVGVLLNEQHSFMHDLESFFWVLFWICIHYNSLGKGRVYPKFDKWNFTDAEELAFVKTGMICNEGDFLRIAEANFTSYYHPLITCINKLRKAVFPHGRRWVKESEKLYAKMRKILLEAKKDPTVLAET